MRRQPGSARRARRDRGSMAVELVIAAPALMVLILLLSAGGEWLNLNSAVSAAARDSVRAASLARSLSAATTDAQQAAAADLGDVCAGNVGTVPTFRPVLYRDGVPLQSSENNFAVADVVKVTVTCVAQLGVFRAIGLRSSHTFTASAVAPLDPFTGRQ
ncbi:MAG: TadE family protein [Streptosporangiaceae bacterium]|jgi:Flp pilus assembly protein TadG